MSSDTSKLVDSDKSVSSRYHEEYDFRYSWSIKLLLVLIVLAALSISCYLVFGNRTRVVDFRINHQLFQHITANKVAVNFNETIHMYDITVLKTKLAGVSYEGGHWFHMAENFLAHHSDMKASNYEDFNSAPYPKVMRHLVYVFDDGKIDPSLAITPLTSYSRSIY
jgi:hypothetical protein